MQWRQIFFLLLISAVVGIASAGRAQDTVYRLGIPKGFNAPGYKQLFSALEQKKFVINDNLKIVPIDLDDYQTEAGKERIRREIAEQCDLFFTTGDHLGIILDVEIQSPLLFVGFKGPKHEELPPAMQANATGIYRGSTTKVFIQSVQLLPEDQRKNLGLIYFRGSKLETLVPKYQQASEELGIALVVKDFSGKEDIERVMREFKAEGVSGIVLFPPAARQEELAELIFWQNRLKMPIIGQTRSYIELGLLGGPTIDYKILSPSLADYAVKIFEGRNPGQLPIKYISDEYVVNLSTVSVLGIKIPQEVVDQAEIVGIATQAKPRQEDMKPLVSGNYVIGMPIGLPSPTKGSLINSLVKRGYVEGENLVIVKYDLKGSSDPQKQQKARELISTAGVIFAPGNILPSLIHLPGFETPVCFIATKETAAIIPSHLKNNYTGVIRASMNSIIEMSQQMMRGAKRMGMLARADSNLHRLIGSYQKIADDYGITIEFRLFASEEEIGPAMQEMKLTNDFILLFPPSITPADLAEVVKWQNRLRFPVLSQFKNHIEAGVLGGPVVDLRKVTPKVAEYMDRLLQGRDPASLPIYYFPEKYVINLRAANILQLDIPDSITLQAEIIR
jgi:ABC-type uncharacterized transport system substrate-binding protein